MSLQAYDIANTASQRVTTALPMPAAAPIWHQTSYWIKSTARQLCQFQKLQPGWDSYGAVGISRQAADLMIEVLADVMNPNAPAPTIVPSAQGHLQAEWHMKGIDLEIEAIDSTHIVVDYDGPGGAWSEVLSVDLGKLVRAIDRLSTP